MQTLYSERTLMFEKSWRQRLLYDKLVAAVPLLKEMDPEINAKCSLMNKDGDIIDIECQSLSIISFLFNVDENFYTSPLDEYYDTKYGKPDNKPLIIKKAMITAIMLPIKQITKPIFGLYFEAGIPSIAKTGDMKIEFSSGLSSSGFSEEKVGLLLNNKTKKAKPLYKIHDNPDIASVVSHEKASIIYCDFNERILLDYLNFLQILPDSKTL